MTTDNIRQARLRAAAQKRWGRWCEAAILAGGWDNGNIVRRHLVEIEAEQLRNRQEAEHG